MNKRDTILNYIQREFVAGKGDIQIGYDDDLLLSGFVNSLQVMRLVAFIEEEYQVNIPPADIILENFETVTAISNYLSSLSS